MFWKRNTAYYVTSKIFLQVENGRLPHARTQTKTENTKTQQAY